MSLDSKLVETLSKKYSSVSIPQNKIDEICSKAFYGLNILDFIKTVVFEEDNNVDEAFYEMVEFIVEKKLDDDLRNTVLDTMKDSFKFILGEKVSSYEIFTEIAEDERMNLDELFRVALDFAIGCFLAGANGKFLENLSYNSAEMFVADFKSKYDTGSLTDEEIQLALSKKIFSVLANSINYSDYILLDVKDVLNIIIKTSNAIG